MRIVKDLEMITLAHFRHLISRKQEAGSRKQ